MKAEEIQIGQHVVLTVEDLGRPADDLRYLRRQGRYADPKYGPGFDGAVLRVAGIIDGHYAQLQEESSGLMAYLADPSEIEVVA